MSVTLMKCQVEERQSVPTVFPPPQIWYLLTCLTRLLLALAFVPQKGRVPQSYGCCPHGFTAM